MQGLPLLTRHAAHGTRDRPHNMRILITNDDGMNAPGLVALESALESLRKQGLRIALVGLQKQPAELIARAHLAARFPDLRICPRMDDALAQLVPLAGPRVVEPAAAERGGGQAIEPLKQT